MRATARGAAGSIQDVYDSDLIVLVGLDPAEAAPVLDLHIKRAVTAEQDQLARDPPAPDRGGEVCRRLPARLARQRGCGAQRDRSRRAGPERRRAARAARGDDEWTWLRNAPGAKPEAVLAASGVTLAHQSAAAELLLKAQRPLFLYGAEAATGERGGAAVSALQNLAALAGQPDRVAYIADGRQQPGLPRHGPAARHAARPAAAGRAGGARAFEQAVGCAATGGSRGWDTGRWWKAACAALYVVGDNPAADPTLRAKLDSLDFLVVQDLFLTETAQLADVVLPAVSWAEADGTYTNLERRVQRAPKAHPANGTARPIGRS